MTPRWDERQRAMLGALGVNWWPAGAPAARPTAPRAARVAAPETASIPIPVVAPAPVPRATPAPAALRPVAAALAEAPQLQRPVAQAEGLDWPELNAAIHACRACGLCEQRRQAVPGVGHGQAQWLIVGEGPGEQEDLQGEPFVGASGQLLDAMLAALKLTRAVADPERQVFIANAVKCRPPGNRNPEPEEIAACRPFLLRQIELVRPRMVLALGRIAARALLSSEAPLGQLRGRVHQGPGGVPVVVSYHPAYLLRNPLEKARAWDDLCLAADGVEAHGAEPAP